MIAAAPGESAFVENPSRDPMPITNLKALAIYLPQFHPIPENDEWWGAGFTEWTNVTGARRLFPGHYQPRLPTDLGFTDLRLPEVRQAQADLARAHGIHGFCYYHYWFEGRRLIERPFDEVLASGEPDFPFCLCWANETWSRRWLGEEREVLLKQTYSMADHERHAAWLARAFADPRHVRVGGRPLFLIYRPFDIPDLERALEVYRTTALRELGVDPYLVGVDSHRAGADMREHGFDAAMNFTPQLGLVPGALEDWFSKRKLLRNLKHGAWDGRLTVADYREMSALFWERRPRHDHWFPSVFVGWDNTARRKKRGVVMVNDGPEPFARNIRQAVEVLASRPEEERILFVNAWNEWAEGNHLEPDLRHGLGMLEALRAELQRAAGLGAAGG